MNAVDSPALLGRVASIHLHPAEPGAPLQAVEAADFVEGKGISGDARYFGKLGRDTGTPSRRQVSLIEREQIEQHAQTLGLGLIRPGAVRSNVETSGVDLVKLVGQEIEIGEAVLFVYVARDPCAKMDAICQGLRERMMHGRQGVMAEIRKSGKVQVGDPIRLHGTA